ncbi:deaminase [Ruficoccus sp. ZRK36]|uniref:deaminase n=1 Tax=Ruficoccus sp. ZRK36 TaxID=2866311 RepID=UPI001C7312C2|nr:deaminase [Ruficoccus sp. ZRK36]QYY36860.1 hypothetical protein K0V07_05125 [Ruficoccus sp. ZRK36]
MIGVYSDRESRIKALTSRGDTRSNAESLIDRDFRDIDDHGQDVRGLFPLSDFFIDVSTNTNSNLRIKRFFDAIFGTKTITPDISERAMFSAWSAGLNSACLSRQVGASIVDNNGIIIGTGWNDVPKYGGGIYCSENNNGDKRCYKYRTSETKDCRNDNEKDVISEQMVSELVDIGIIDKKHERDAYDYLRNKSRLSDLIEFSRAIHAEMNAIFNALGSASSRVKGASIYVTTYPCHNCARHIILSGIERIYFIEPYPKSKATKLHDDSLTERNEANKVKLIPFEGIAPTRFSEIFSTQGRVLKSDGNATPSDTTTARLPQGISLAALFELEREVAKVYDSKIQK